MTHKIAVSNQKGGVGKTAIAINVAGALNKRGHDVLFVDLDPQGNATEGLGHERAYEAQPPSLFDVLTNSEDRSEIQNLVHEHDEMDVIPSNIDMAAAEPELTLSRRGAEQLDLALNELDTDYDYTIIDCPPNLGNLTDNGLLAAQNVLIPALAESTSKRAFELLFDHIKSLERDFEIDIAELAAVANRVDVRKNETQDMLNWFDRAFDDINIFEIRDRATIQKSFSDRVSIFEHDEACDMEAEFMALAKDLDEQFGITPEVTV